MHVVTSIPKLTEPANSAHWPDNEATKLDHQTETPTDDRGSQTVMSAALVVYFWHSKYMRITVESEMYKIVTNTGNINI